MALVRERASGFGVAAGAGAGAAGPVGRTSTVYIDLARVRADALEPSRTGPAPKVLRYTSRGPSVVFTCPDEIEDQPDSQ